MKPPPFSYYDPRTVADAIGLLARLDNAKVLAGGQSLMPMLNMRYVLPDHVIDLNRVEGLSYVRETGGAIEIGAMTRQRELEFSDLIRTRLPLMQEAILQVGHRQTRNRGTIGGSLCHLDPAAELVSVGAGYDATVVVTGPAGQRQIAFADFPVAYMTPAIELNEILTAIRFTPWAPGHGYAFVEFARRHGDFAITSAAALLEADGAGKITRASVTIGGAAVLPVRASEVEKALVGQVPTPNLVRQACESCRAIEAIEDIHAPASYRQHLAAVLSRRALDKAIARLGKPVPASLRERVRDSA
jgi:carbon-monoxide dehydrogenase medium subunit